MILTRELKILWKKAIYNDNNKSIYTKWKQSLLAIASAILLTSILILIKGQNPFFIFSAIIRGSVQNADSLNQMLIYYAMFLITGLAIVVAFKVKLFNIGVSGQMVISGVTMMIIAVKTSLPWIIILLIGMLVGFTVAAFAGLFKALFNIHEVVSSIMFNWIFFYVSQYLLSPSMSWIDEFGTTKAISSGSRMQIGDSIVLPALLLALFLLVSAIILFKYTKYGYALKMVGSNQFAAKYAGTKIPIYLALAMGLSGFIAGALAGVNYLGKFGAMSKSTSISLPAIGFQGISVALIAFKSFFGLIPAALFWAIINSGAGYVTIIYPDIPGEILQLMNGFVIYMVAISIIFIRFKPIKILWLLYLKMTSPEIKKERSKANQARQSQYSLFKDYYYRIKKSDDGEHLKEIKQLNLQKKQVLTTIRSKEKIFRKKNKKPSLFVHSLTNIKMFHHWFKIELFHSAKKVYEQKKYKYTAEEYEKYENIIKQIKNLEKNLQKQLVKKNKTDFKNALEIINNEYKQRLIGIQNNYINNSIVGRWKAKWQLNKYKSHFFEENYILLNLALKKDLKDAKTKEMRHKIKVNFHNKIDKLKIKTQKLKLQEGDK